MEYNILLDVFKGPLDLLLHLIDDAKIDIYDIPINLITDQYLSYLDEMESLNLDITSEFLVMASTLLQIKSNRLLPKKVVEDEDEEDPEELLIKRLIEYKKYKEIANEIKIMGEDHYRRFYKKQEDFADLIEDELLLEEVSLEQLSIAFKKIIEMNKEITEELDLSILKIHREEFPVERSMDKLKNMLKNTKEFYFEEAFNLSACKSEIISMFLAILELTKIKFIRLKQNKNYSQISIVKSGC